MASPTLSVAGTYADAGQAVVRIHAYGTYKAPLNGKPDFDDYGTGFVVSPDGLILTAGHNVPRADLFAPGQLWIEVQRAAQSGVALTVTSTIEHVDVLKAATSPHDVAILKLQGNKRGLQYLRLCSGYSMTENLMVLGYTGGGAVLSQTRGSVKTPSVDDAPLVMQLPLSQGDSGGPVFNESGRVIAIAVGGATMNGERLEAATEAEVMPTALNTLTPATAALFGVSYDPDCNKALPAEGQTSEFTQSFLLKLNSGKTVRFNAPTGYQFTEILNSNVQKYSDDEGVASITKTNIADDRRSVDMQIISQGPASGPFRQQAMGVVAGVTARLLADMRPLTLASAQGPSVRSFAVSRTLEEHAPINVTTRHFIDQIGAPAGFRFKAVVDAHNVSLNHSPSHGATTSISPDGSTILVSYDLESGPIYDQWRGWIDVIVVAELVPAAAN